MQIGEGGGFLVDWCIELSNGSGPDMEFGKVCGEENTDQTKFCGICPGKLGCLDQAACNYDGSAETNDPSLCRYCDVNDGEGCRPGVCGKICCRRVGSTTCPGYDSRCGNPPNPDNPFEEIYTVGGDGTCPDVSGCTNPGAQGYDPCANISDGSCELSGCMDPDAINYNPNATIQQYCDCEYQAIHCGGCTDYPIQDPERPFNAEITGLPTSAEISEVYKATGYTSDQLRYDPRDSLTALNANDTGYYGDSYYQEYDPYINDQRLATETIESARGEPGSAGEFCGMWAKYSAAAFPTNDSRTFRGWVRNAVTGVTYDASEIANRCGCKDVVKNTGRCCISCSSPDTDIKQSCTTLGVGGATGTLDFNGLPVTVDCDNEDDCQSICAEIASKFGVGPTQNFEWGADCNDGVCPVETCPGVAEIEHCCFCLCPDGINVGVQSAITVSLPEGSSENDINDACSQACDNNGRGYYDYNFAAGFACGDLNLFDCPDTPSSFLGLIGRKVRVVNPIGTSQAQIPEPRSPERDNKLPLNYGKGTSSFNLVRPPNVAQEARVRSDYFTTKYNNANSYEINYGFYHARKIVNGECVTMMCPTLDGTDNYCRALEDCE
ncbi:hypothetical protein [Hyphomonas sp.]|uniref:hypothetical protein n=1 Tax=Hyphomonas sp. TaxID=87 RepID=UPI0025C3F992|nr:hypothetical protein [Hyphomonas sp.]